jgi:hypothetical protein
MNVSILNSYNPYINTKEQSVDNQNLEQSKDRFDSSKLKQLENTNNRDVSVKAANDIITQNEREYFIQLFPENLNSLKQHIVFDRNGKVNTTNLSKGILVDGKV